ncbi:tubulin-tyrosine ligase family-domain-containing protein [Haematococcus lacustris]
MSRGAKYKAHGCTALRSEQRNSGTFRFWHDERRFKGSGTNCVVQSALFSQGGVRTGGYPKAAPVPGPLGWQRPTDWDLLWSPARVALQAAPGLQPGQLISAMPGLMSLTRKRKLGSTLEAALGATAWDLVPRTFTLPDQLPELKAHLAAQAALPNPAASPALTTCQPGSQPASLAEVDGEGPDGAKLEGVEGPGGAGVVPGLVGGLSRFWILKTAQHLGKGLVLLPEEQAAPAKPYVVAQRYVGNPLLIEGRKFGLRVWVLVTGQSPLRAYMHSNGLVLFSTHHAQLTIPSSVCDPLRCDPLRCDPLRCDLLRCDPSRYDAASWQGSGSAGVGLGHVTNYAQNMDGMVWDLGRLEQHLGAPAWALLWGRIQRSAALMVAAALKDMQANHAELQLPPESTFELLGLDYLVDTSMTPWLLEVNGTPSLAVDHEDAKVEQMIHIQKAGMVSDMFRLLGVSTRFKPRYDARRVAVRRARATAGTSASPANVDNGEGALAEGIVAEDRGDEEDFPCAIATAKAAEQLPAAQAREQPAAHAAMALKEVDTTPRPSKHLSPGVDSLCTKSDQLGVGPAARSRRANHERPDLPGQPDEQRRVNGHWQQKRLSSATDARVGRNAWDAIADVRATIHLPASAYTCTAGFEPRADGAGRGAEAMSADDRISGAAAASTIPWREPDMLLQGLLHSRCVVTP